MGIFSNGNSPKNPPPNQPPGAPQKPAQPKKSIPPPKPKK